MELVIPRRFFWLLGALLAIGFGALVAYTYLPRAKIIVTPAHETREATQNIQLSANASAPDFQRFVLPARMVESEITERLHTQRQVAAASDGLAKGVITLKNEQDEPQPLVAKTHMRHEATGVFFLTDAAVEIPAQGSVGVGVTAKEPGVQGEVAAGKFIVDKLPASLQKVVYGESTQQFTGGRAAETPLSEAELAAAQDELTETAKKRLVGELTLKAGGAPIEPELLDVQVASVSQSAEAGSKAVAFETTVTVRGRAFVVDRKDLLSLTLLALRATAQEKEEFSTYDPETFTVEVGRLDFERGEARITGKLTGHFSRKIGSKPLQTEALAGLSAEEVQDFYREQPEVAEVAVEFWPFWVNSVPARAERVEMVVKQ